MSYTRFVFGTDVHGDQQDPQAVSAFHKFCTSWKPQVRIMGGDLWDFRPLRKKACEEERRESMMRDYQMGWQFMETFKPNVFLRGNHSHDRASEILTEQGWVKIDTITMQHRVAQVDSAGRISYVLPTALHETDVAATLVEIEGPYHKQRVTHGHDVLVNGEKVKAGTLLGADLKASCMTGCAQAEPAFTEEDNWVRLLTWVVMDGTVVDHAKYQTGSKKIRVQFKLSYQHKIDRLIALLTEMGIPFTFKPATMSGGNVLQPYYIRIYGDAAREIWARLHCQKTLPPEWASLPESSLRVFLTELAATDGSLKDACISWVSVDRRNVDVVQLWCVRNKVEMAWRMLEKSNGFANAQPQHHCAIRIRDRKSDCVKLSVREVPYNDRAYCVTVPEGRIITRLGGKTALTGNCERAWDLASEDRGIISDYAKKLTNEVETRLNKMHCRMLPYDRRAGVYALGKLRMVHGYGGGGKTTARTHAIAYGHVLIGHTHAIDYYSIPSLAGGFGMTVGCLCKLDMEYLRASLGSLTHAHGWAYGVVNEKTGDFRVWQAEKVAGQFIVAGSPLFL